MKRLWPLVLAILGTWEAALGASQPQQTDAPARKIQVVTVAVPEFSIQDYNNQIIKSTFSERCEYLKSYFEKYLGVENVSIHQYCSKELTTRESLRHLFSIDIPQFSADTLTLIFIISHGEAVHFANGFLSSDLELITSDTNTTDIDKDAKGERQFSSILLGSELLVWLQRAPAGSTILTFVDTCHAGSAESISAGVSGFLQQKYDLRSFVIASSLAQSVSYSALFTKNLLELWETGTECLNQDTLQGQVYKKMMVQAPLDGNDGLPTILVRYNGPLCLGNFGKDRKLLFLYAGHDAEENPLRYDIYEVRGNAQRAVIAGSPLQYTYLPIPLDSNKYLVSVRRGSDAIGNWSVDLTSSGSALIWLDKTANPKDVAKFSEVMADTAEKNGSLKKEIALLRQRSYAVYRAAGLDSDAERVLHTMVAKNETFAISDIAKRLAFQPTKSVMGTISASSGDQVIVAEQLQLLGDFQNAAAIYLDAAQNAPNDAVKAEFAKDAYSSFIASGDLKSANKVRKDYGFEPNSYAIIDAKEAKHQGITADNLKAIGLANSAGIVGAVAAIKSPQL